MDVVVNHLHFRDPVNEATVSAFREGVRITVDAGGLAARVLQVDERHLILVLDFPSADEADRIAKEIGGPWMREHITPLLATATQRNVGTVIASAASS